MRFVATIFLTSFLASCRGPSEPSPDEIIRRFVSADGTVEVSNLETRWWATMDYTLYASFTIDPADFESVLAEKRYEQFDNRGENRKMSFDGFPTENLPEPMPFESLVFYRADRPGLRYYLATSPERNQIFVAALAW